MQMYRLDNLISAGYRWDAATEERLKDPIYLEPYGYKVYSQNDEDGIIAEIFSRIGTTDKRFIEFGVQNGLECNTHYLLFQGWTGLWLEGSQAYIGEIRGKFRTPIKAGRLDVCCAFVTRDNVNQLFAQAGFTGEIDLLSIDVDGNDYHIWEAVDVISPRVVIIEYNAKFPPDCAWCMAYNPAHAWQGTDKHGASLNALSQLADRKGYQLVGTGLNGVNAYFVRKDLTGTRFPQPATPEALYNPFRASLRFANEHPAQECLWNTGDVLDEFNAFSADSAAYLAIHGFHFAEYNTEGFVQMQWMSARQATFLVHVLPDSQTLQLHFAAGVPIQVRASVDGQAEPVVLDVQEPAATMEVPIWNNMERGGVTLSVQLETDRLWSPADHGSADTRSLGVGLTGISFA